MTCEALQMDVEGQRYKDFVLKKLTEIKGLKCTLRELEHEPSGALVLHVANDDDENVFCLSFRTLPDSSNGVAHILEHTVLCGSEKFPVNDPFFSMNRRSLNTFMNALTGSDFTCYPAASQVKKDFYNLLDVYLDAVFKPKLKELSFLQEGHRLGFSDPEDANSQLQYKGVVFNEMKGALSSPDSRVWKELRKHLIPDLTYGIDSGGDPKEIPELTYQQLLDFHGKFYHPSRCLFFFYGNIPLNDHLDFISSNALKGVEKQVSIDPIPLQKRFTAPKKVSDTYPASADQSKDKDSYISLAWLTCHILEQRDVLGLTVLDIILTSTDASPLRYALLQSGLCKQVDGILEDDISEVPYALLMKGCDSESADKLQDLVFDTLQNVLKNGIPVDQVEAAIHQIELYRREISGDSYPFGLNLFMRSALLQQHGGNAEDGMSVDALFEDLRQSVEDPNFLTGLLRKYFLENPHFVLLTMAPDENLAVKENQEERTKLDEIQSKLTEDDKKKIIDNSRSLSDMQEEDEDIEVLPKVTLKDVPLEGKDFTLTQEKIGNIEIFHHGCFTNGLVYADVVFALPEVKKEDLSYLRLFTHLLPQVGSGDRDYKQNLDYILEHTGGLGVSLSLNSQIQDFNQFKPCVTLGGKALHRKVDKLFPLLCDMISSADFTDVARLKELILKHQTGLQSSLNRRAMRYATSLSNASISQSSFVNNYWYGVEYFCKVRDLAANFDAQASEFVEKMKLFQKNFLSQEGAEMVLTCDDEMYSSLKDEAFYGLLDLKLKPYTPWSIQYPLSVIPSQGRVISSPVAFTSVSMPGLCYTNPDAPALSLASMIFDNKTLHKRVREQGGAYGAGSGNSTMAGAFYFYSYRDPHIADTLSAFSEAVGDVVAGKFDERDLEEAKLGMIQGLDSPVTPGSRAYTSYHWLKEGKTFENRQNFRERILAATKEEISQAVQKHISPKLDSAIVVSFAGKELLDQENTELKSRKQQCLEVIEL